MSYQQPPPPGQYPQRDHPQAVVILVLGILSLILCQLVGPVAWVMGRSALREIDASGGAIGGRGLVLAGYVCGIIASVLIILAIVAFVLLLGLGTFASTST